MNNYAPPSADEIKNALGIDPRGARRSSAKRLVWVALLLALAAAGIWLFLARSSGTNEISYETAPAALSDLVVTVSATGKIEPITKVDVGSELSGRIATSKLVKPSRGSM
jgi:HlyD family secretion protein